MSSDALLFGVLTHHGLPYWTLAMISGFAHTIYTLIVLFIVFGLVERLGFCGISVWRSLCGSVAEHENSLLPLPVPTPTVCVQLPMYNEPDDIVDGLLACVSQLEYPKDRLLVQVVDDLREL